MDAQANDDAARERIIKHMNQDHHDSLVRYLEYYSNVPSYKAYDAVMTDITLERMVFRCSGSKDKIEIPLDPPLDSFRDTRERVVAMDKECIESLGKSDVTVQEFIPPTAGLFYTIEFAIITATFLGFSRRYWFETGQIVDRVFSPGFARFCWFIQPWLIWFMLALHVGEAVYFAGILRKHSVNIRSTLYWKWIATIFIEGVFAMKRFGDLVERKREENLKKKH